MNVKPQTKILSVLAAVLIAAGAAGCGQDGLTGAPATAPAESTAAPATPDAAPSESAPASPSASKSPAEQPAKAGTALALLKTITVKGRAPKTGYTREQFGNGWQDPDGNGCDARNDILNRDLS